jgi:hypothetical protein
MEWLVTTEFTFLGIQFQNWTVIALAIFVLAIAYASRGSVN